jgi:8-oxo-dGTP pyrophosphatase MutT (NUDIX family)
MDGLTQSSVILPIIKTDTGFHILLTKRSPHLKSHPGQISFPGGVFEPGDQDLLETALREWEEEIGISRENLIVHGYFTSIPTGTGFQIHCYIAEVNCRMHPQKCDSHEVEKIFLLSESDFWNSPLYEMEREFHGRKYKVYYIETDGGLLWGATCELIRRFMTKFRNTEPKVIPVNSNLDVAPYFDPNRWKTESRK